MAVLIFFFLVLCVGFPLGQVIRISPSLTTSFTVLDVIVGVGTMVWLIGNIFKHPFRLSLQAKAFFFVTVAFVLSLAINIFSLPLSEVWVASLYILRWVVYGMLFFIAYSLSAKQKKTVLFFLLIGGLTLLLSGFVQFFLYPALRNLLYAGWDEHFYRMFGTFLDPNFLGLFLVSFFLFLVGFLPKHRMYRLGAAFLAALTFVGIMLTYSRTALVALGVGLVVLFWRVRYTRNMLLSLSSMVAVGIVVLLLVGYHAEGNNLFRTTSSDARIGNARNALVIFLDNPVFGVGFNAYRFAQYKHHFMAGNPLQQDHGGSGADSSLLFVLATSGAMGIAAFLFFLFVHGRALLTSRNRVGIAILIAIVVGSTFVDGLFYPSIMAWMWTLFGIIESDGQ